ncbi:MAG TPA: hypothetical protein VMX75_01755 [Spirochaetia bacterium]|nr:hypothetical protein [Spirochaetia bacterium]
MDREKNDQGANARHRFAGTLIVLLMLTLLLFTVSCQRDNWEPFISQKGGFQVSVPVRFEQRSRILQTPIGDSPLSVFVAGESDATAFYVGYSDLPGLDNSETGWLRNLKNGREQALKSRGGKLIYERKIEIRGNPGLEFSAEIQVEGQTAHWKARCYIVGQRLYQVFGIAVQGKGAISEVERFINSFRLTG